MVLKLYAQDMSPPCRSVYVTAAALDLELDIIVIDVWKKQQFSETFLKINPHHKIPTLDDDGTIIWDSQAIITYLVCKYGKDDSFYPNNCKVRAVINQHLFYNASVIFPLARKLILKIARQKCIDEVDVLETNKMYESLEMSLMNSAWLGGDCVTIADFAVIPNVTSIGVMTPFDQKKYPNVSKLIEATKKLPYFHVNEKGLNDMKEFVDNKLFAWSSL